MSRNQASTGWQPRSGSMQSIDSDGRTCLLFREKALATASEFQRALGETVAELSRCWTRMRNSCCFTAVRMEKKKKKSAVRLDGSSQGGLRGGYLVTSMFSAANTRRRRKASRQPRSEKSNGSVATWRRVELSRKLGTIGRRRKF